MKYRRHINIDIHQGNNSWNNFVEQTKKAVANDKKLKNNYVRVAYSPCMEVFQTQSFYLLLWMKLELNILKILKKEQQKEVSKDWKKMQGNNLASLLKKKILCSKINLKINYTPSR